MMTDMLILVWLVAAISVGAAICSRAVKTYQRAFALAGAGLTGEQQALAWIPGTGDSPGRRAYAEWLGERMSRWRKY